ncbi:MAG: phosphoribosyltransferase [Candidatus Dadabacteria bacterium]
MNTKSWDEINDRLNSIAFEEPFDTIVAIANGGVVPAALINQKLQVQLELLKVNYRDDKQQPKYDAPKLMENIHFDVKGKKVLLVEDRVKTGATLNYAKELLQDAAIVKTFAVNGKADYSLFDEACFSFPWIIKNKRK